MAAGVAAALVGSIGPVVFAPGAVAADGPPVPKHPLPVPSGDPAAAAKAGYLPGSGSVGPNGAFTYGMPLTVPEGRAGVQPQLSLNYSSSGGDGAFGLGWSLSGMGSSITRCATAPDSEGARSGISYDKKDRYCLDGAKLVGVGASGPGQSGEYGADGTEYRTESDGFAKIVSVNANNPDMGPDKFLVYGKDGRISTYEAQAALRTTDSVNLAKEWEELRTEVYHTPDGTVFTKRIPDIMSAPYVKQHSTVHSMPRVIWLLKSVKDRSGNEMRYTYDPTTSAQFGNKYPLKKIDYTFGPGRDAARSVEFAYESRHDATSAWVNGVRYVNDERVKSVTMKAPNPTATTAVRTYNFTYRGAGTADHDKTRSLLWKVQECGAKGGCLPYREFRWTGAEDLPSFTTSSLGNWNPASEPSPDGLRPSAQVLDVDGDGSDDLLTQNSSATGRQVEARLGSRNAAGVVSPLADRRQVSGVGGFPDVLPVGNAPGLDLREGRPVDIEGDGTPEFMVKTVDLTGTHERMLRWNKGAHRFDSTSLVFDADGYFSDFADLDGDGLMDRISADVPSASPDEGNRRTLSVRMNKGGGTFGPSVNSDIPGKCPGARVSDTDGDGRADLILDKPLTTPDYNGKFACSTGQHTVAVRAGSDGSGALQAVPGKGADDAVGTGGWKFSPLAPQGVSSRKVSSPDDAEGGLYLGYRFNALANWIIRPGDYNGDGLQDTLMMSKVQGADSVMLWNTGAGLFWDGKAVQIPLGSLPATEENVQVADVNGDGRDDVVGFRSEIDGPVQKYVAIMLSKGDGTFSVDEVTAGPIDRMAKLGDFNGDGLLDLLRAEKTALKVMIQNAPQSGGTRISDVRDEDAPYSRNVVTYSQEWNDHPDLMGEDTCQAPLQCMRRGMTVVRELLTREHGLMTSLGSSEYFSYRDPVAHVRQGFLGFGEVTSWKPTRPSQTVTTYDLRTTFDGGKRYPFAGRPKTVTTVTPILSQNEVADKPAAANARISVTGSSDEYRPGNGGKTFAVFPKNTGTDVWDQSVAINWGESLAGSENAQHVEWVEHQPQSGPDKQVKASSTYDSYGNLTDTTSATTGGVSGSTHTDFDLSPQRQLDWLVGLPEKQTAQQTEAGTSSPVTTVTGFEHDERGLPTAVHTEPGNTDELRSSARTEFDGLGVPVKMTASAPGRPDQVTHLEYDNGKMFGSTQPDERIYPSQTWQEYAVAAYRPTTWQAVHPALGVTVATEDVNGTGSTTSVDDLGRPVRSEADGTQPTTLAYAPYKVTAGGNVLGMQVTATTGQNVTKTVTAPAGNTHLTTTTGFAGETVTTATGYDNLGRVAYTTRPSAGTPDPSEATSVFYDSLDRPTETEYPDETNSSVTYPSFFTTQTEDPRGAKTVTTTDVDGRIRTTVGKLRKPGGTTADVTTTYAYKRLQSVVTDDKGNKTTTDFDILGRPTKLTDPDRGTSTTSYYGNGQVNTTTRPGQQTGYHYDALGRPTSTVADVGGTKRTDTYVWDTAQNGVGQLDRATSGDNITTAYRYDDMGRPIGTDYTDAATNTTYKTDQHYDAQGRPDTMTYPAVPGRNRLSVSPTYNTYGHISDIKDTTDPQAPKQLWHATARNADMALTAATLGAGATISLSNTYNPQTGRLEKSTAERASDKAVLQNRGYTYYDDGMVHTRTQTDTTANRSETFTYNDFDQLTGWNLTNGPDPQLTTSYGYNTIGNLETVTNNKGLTDTRTYGRNDGTLPHALTSRTTTGGEPAVDETYTYDTLGRQEATKKTTTTLRATTYTPFDLPRTVTKDGKTTTFAYDAFGTRIKKTGPDGTSFTLPGLFEDRTDTAGKHSYVFYLTGPEGAIGQAVHDATGTKIDYTLTDQLGSVSTTVNDTGQIGQTFFYDPYGARTTAAGTRTTTTGSHTHGYTGQEHDDNLGLINMNARAYDPDQNQFLTPDTVLSNHPYNYANASPLNHTDPTGNDPTCPLGLCPSNNVTAGIMTAGAIGTGQYQSGYETPGGPGGMSGLGGGNFGFGNPYGTFGNAGSDGGSFTPIINNTQQILDDIKATYDDYVYTWDRLRNEGISYSLTDPYDELAGINRETYNTNVGAVIDTAAITAAAASLAYGTAEVLTHTGIGNLDYSAWQAVGDIVDILDEGQKLGGSFLEPVLDPTTDGVNPWCGTYNCIGASIADDATANNHPALAVPAYEEKDAGYVWDIEDYQRSLGIKEGVLTASNNSQLERRIRSMGDGSRAIVVGHNHSIPKTLNHTFTVRNVGGIIEWRNPQRVAVDIERRARGYRGFWIFRTK